MLKKSVVCFLLLATLLGSCVYTFYLNIGSWLTTADVPEKADIIVCLDGSIERIDKAVQLLQEGLAEKVVVTTNGAYQEMLRRKVPPGRIMQADRSATSTYEEGLLLKKLLQGGRYRSALVVSDPYHLYRVKWTFHNTFADTAPSFSFISSDARSLQGFWWSNERSRLFVLSELPKIVYYRLWHGLLGVVADPEWAVELERIYLKLIRAVFIRRVS